MDSNSHTPAGGPTDPHLQPPQSAVPSNAANANQQDNKRAALAGQWRTPPMPAFPSAPNSVPNAQAPQPAPVTAASSAQPVNVNRLPDSTEDYAKALQEAYRRGAEAAQAMAAASSKKQPPPVAANASQTVIPVASAPQQTAPRTTQPSAGSTHPPPQLIHPQTGVPQPIAASVPNPLSMPPPNPVPPVATAMPPPQMHPGAKPIPGMQPATPRSMSLPDMSSYAAQQEEEKRQKRLARNRASARLRRLRKKNLVEAYEQEVGILEKTLAQLKAHNWGESDNVSALTEALSMDRGQQVLTFEQRHEAATSLLDQQLQWIEMLEEIMMEDYVLQNVRSGEFAELREILGLDEEQLNQIEASKSGWDEEWAALQTLKASLIAMRENDWLWNESVSSIAEQFMSILHKNQVSKFLLWADHNAEAIDELDGVNAYPGTPNGPVFAFGVESQPGENYGEEEK